MQLFYQSEILTNNYLDSEESRHCIKVLRHNVGDKIFVTDGKGHLYRVRIAEANPHKCSFYVEEKVEAHSPRAFSVHIGIAPTKNMDRTEWFVEKSVEIGVEKITFFTSQNSERQVIKPERLIKKAISAMKQSLNLKLPEISVAKNFKQMLLDVVAEQKFIGYIDKSALILKEQTLPGKSYCFLVGPEGDFTPDEVQLAEEIGFVPVLLAGNRLRTETAGIVAVHAFNFLNQ